MEIIVETYYEKPNTERVWERLLHTPNRVDFKKVYLKENSQHAR